MYGKIFGSIYDGTLAEDWRALVTFQQFIILCDADGIVDMTPLAISRRTGIPIEHIKAGVEVLERVDKYSRTPDQEGRRIELIDPHRPWGWHIINHEIYKKRQDSETVRAQTRDRVKKHRELKRTVTDSNGQKRHIDTDIDTDLKIKTLGQKKNFDRFWSEYPRKVKKKEAEDIWKRKKLDGLADVLVLDVKNRLQKDNSWKNGFIPHPTTYLRGERWTDDIEIKTYEPEMKSKSQVMRIGTQSGLKPKVGETMEAYETRVRMHRGK